MSEQIFTVLEGSDEGMTFTLDNRAVEIGRDPDRDVVLKDDRASRAHTKLISEGDTVRLCDLDSSNGTFVNGHLVSECILKPGDIIVIGNTKIVYGTEAPPPPPPPNNVQRPRIDMSGSETEILVDGEPLLEVRPTEAQFSGILEAVIEFCRPLAESLGVFLTIETDASSDKISVDVQHAHRALSGLINLFLKAYGASGITRVLGKQDSTLALRLAPAPASASLVVEIIWMGTLFPRDGIDTLDTENAIGTARNVINAHGGSFRFLPDESMDTLAQLRFPIGYTRQTRPTIIR